MPVALIEIATAQVLIDPGSLEDVVGEDEERMTDCHGSALHPPSRRQPMELGRPMSLLGMARGVGGLDQSGSQSYIPSPRLPALALAGALVVAGTHPGPQGQVDCRGEAAHIHARTIPL